MEVTIRIRTIEIGKREVITESGEESIKQIYTHTNAIFPVYKELIYFCRKHPGAELDIYSNSVSFITDLKHLDLSEKRLATMLKCTLEETSCSIKSVTYVH